MPACGRFEVFGNHDFNAADSPLTEKGFGVLGVDGCGYFFKKVFQRGQFGNLQTALSRLVGEMNGGVEVQLIQLPGGQFAVHQTPPWA